MAILASPRSRVRLAGAALSAAALLLMCAFDAEARSFRVESSHSNAGDLFADSRLSWSAGMRRSNRSIHEAQT
jgi:hypothetical protein